MNTQSVKKFLCSCGTQCQHKIFVQFDYWYCPKCKVEVKYSSLPDGFVALSGENITTDCCHEIVGKLLNDLPSDVSLRPNSIVNWNTMYTGCKECKVDRSHFVRKLNIWTTFSMKEEIRYHVQNRGWV